MRAYRDLWGDKWVRHSDEEGGHWYEPFSWKRVTHAFTYFRQLGRIPDRPVRR